MQRCRIPLNILCRAQNIAHGDRRLRHETGKDAGNHEPGRSRDVHNPGALFANDLPADLADQRIERNRIRAADVIGLAHGALVSQGALDDGAKVIDVNGPKAAFAVADDGDQRPARKLDERAECAALAPAIDQARAQDHGRNIAGE